MNRDFKPSVKGKVAEALFAAMLEDCGYKVISIGVEHSIKELKELTNYDPSGYHASPVALRKLPDFIVLDLLSSSQKSFFVEIKFRKNADAIKNDSKLWDALLIQVNTWKNVCVVFFLGNPFNAGTLFHDESAATNSCRVFELTEKDDKVHIVAANNVSEYYSDELVPSDKFYWANGYALEKYFCRLQDKKEQETIKRSVSIMRSVYQALEEER